MTSFEPIGDLDDANAFLKMALAENQRLVARNKELLRLLAKAEGKDSEQLQLQLAQLQEEIARFQAKIFGASTERRPSGHAAEKELVRELSADQQTCPACGEQLEEMQGQTEDSEVITALLAEYRKLQIKRKKYRCRCNGAIVTAPGIRKVIAGGRYSAPFATQVAVDKYVDHLPLERQVRIMKRAGLHCDSQTLWDQLDALAVHL